MAYAAITKSSSASSMQNFTWRFGIGFDGKNSCTISVIAPSLSAARATILKRLDELKTAEPKKWLSEYKGWTVSEGPFTYLSETVLHSRSVSEEVREPPFTSHCSRSRPFPQYETLAELVSNELPGDISPFDNIIITSALDG